MSMFGKLSALANCHPSLAGYPPPSVPGTKKFNWLVYPNLSSLVKRGLIVHTSVAWALFLLTSLLWQLIGQIPAPKLSPGLSPSTSVIVTLLLDVTS